MLSDSIDVREVPCMDGSQLASANFTSRFAGRCSHVFGLLARFADNLGDSKWRAPVYCQNAHRVVSWHAATIKCRTNGYKVNEGKENGTRSLDGSSVKTETNYY